jgi:hypothetical protein
MGGDLDASTFRRNPGDMQAKRKGLGNGPKMAPRPIRDAEAEALCRVGKVCKRDYETTV